MRLVQQPTGATMLNSHTSGYALKSQQRRWHFAMDRYGWVQFIQLNSTSE
jgi:hypothetical protein